MAEVELVLDCKNQLGEGPMWSVQEQVLYWVDIMGEAVQRYDPQTGDYTRYNIGQMVGTVVLRQSGGFVLALHHGLAFWDPEGGLQPIVDPEPDKPDSRFNDGAVDRQGRFWAGTMDMSEDQKPVSALYRLDPDLTVQTMATNIYISNGLGWSPDNTIMYYVDTPRRVIWAYDFDPATGAIANRRDFVTVPEDDPGGPDGLTVDSEGFIWLARWGGWKVSRFDPAGQLEREVKVPAARVTSVMFGGPDLTELYITCARMDFDEATEPHAGGLFRLQTSIKGLPEPAFAG